MRRLTLIPLLAMVFSGCQGEESVLPTAADPELNVRAPGIALLVNSDNDADDGLCDLSHCSLREALNAANANPGADLIEFEIPGTGVNTIRPLTPLPVITDPVFIDGFSQPGAKPNTKGLNRAPNTSLKIVLDGGSAPSPFVGLRITTSDCTVQGLVIHRFSSAIIITGAGATGNHVRGNYLGTDATGLIDLGNTRDGVVLTSGASNNTIGGRDAKSRNLIAGNGISGIFIQSSGTQGNVVQGNFIGTDATGATAMNTVQGIVIAFSATDNTIGGAAKGEGNLISGNSFTGLNIGTPANRVIGNLIGSDLTGTEDVGNQIGLRLASGANGNQIGGTERGAGNLISGNSQNGLTVGSGASGNRIEGNLVGTDITGRQDLGNAVNGIIVFAPGNFIGGTARGAGNVVSGNGFAGVNIFSSSNTIQGNLIGTDARGRSAIPNDALGLTIQTGAMNNLVGGTSPDARNVISGNGSSGLEGGLTLISGATGNRVHGNYIGTDIRGRNPLGNRGPGVYIAGNASNNLIGGTAEGEANTIAFNEDRGFKVTGGAGVGNALLGNSVHSNGLLGIDLGVNGVTPNDPNDTDSGPNNYQNYPVLAAATGGVLTGSLNSTPLTAFRLEFFANDLCDASGHGEGQAFLGAMDVTTDASGNTSFSFSLPRSRGDFLTATATDPSGNTSEFAACLQQP